MKRRRAAGGVPAASEAEASDLDDADSASDAGTTVIWGDAMEADDFIKVPRTVLYLARYDSELRKKIGHGPMLLLLVLAARKFRNRDTAAFWEALALDLGVSIDTVRRWGYALKKEKLLDIQNRRLRRDPDAREPSVYRNDRNIYDIAPFVKALSGASAAREAERKERRAKRAGEAKR